MAKKKDDGEKSVATNRKAYHDYFILERHEAGMALSGTEVKSLRDGRANLKDAYVIFKSGEAWLFGLHISPYSHGNLNNHEPERTRKLLLHRREIDKLAEEGTIKGNAVIPLRIYFKGSRAKVEVAVVKGKRQYDKRETERTKEADREAASAMKHGHR
ncbi:MAG: SsrA-binding protein SmpB [Thermoanaerobaculia bacterium]|jgi:SsrA-binding protein